MDTRKRSIAKTVTSRLWTFVMITTMLWLWFDLSVSQSIAYVITVNVLQTGSYYIHERVWDNVLWGRSQQQQSKKKTER